MLMPFGSKQFILIIQIKNDGSFINLTQDIIPFCIHANIWKSEICTNYAIFKKKRNNPNSPIQYYRQICTGRGTPALKW